MIVSTQSAMAVLEAKMKKGKAHVSGISVEKGIEYFLVNEPEAGRFYEVRRKSRPGWEQFVTKEEVTSA